MSPVEQLRAAVLRAAASLGADVDALKSPPSIERPKQADHGDYATNAAMMLAKPLGRPPRDVAAQLTAALQAELGDQLVAAEIAGPGFINLRLADAWFAGALGEVLVDGYGRGGAAVKQKVNVEFVSANPTGPLHLGHARNAAYGDAVARLQEFAGHDVTREYYVNDYGTQIRNFALTLQARAQGEPLPEGGYPGDYAVFVALGLDQTDDLDALGRAGVQRVLAAIELTLRRFRITFDVWFSERSLHEEGLVEQSLTALDEQFLFRADGALWMRTTDHGDDKDRVLVRSSGDHTYFTSDIAYHWNKRERGFQQLIDVWGADHHGYINRMRAAYAALGGDPGDLDLITMQLVKLMEKGEEVKMSKREGTVISLDWLLDEIGVDAARWFLLKSSHDSPLLVDLDQARDKSRENNPVIYVQYMHARASKIGRDSTVAADAALPSAELHPSERALVMKLADFPAEMLEAGERRAPHRVTTYAYELAQAYSAFYRDCPVIGDPSEAFRAALTAATRQVLSASLGLLGISAPDEM